MNKLNRAVAYCQKCERCEHIIEYTIDKESVATIQLGCGHTQSYTLITTRLTNKLLKKKKVKK